jgi:hypothetical protein
LDEPDPIFGRRAGNEERGWVGEGDRERKKNINTLLPFAVPPSSLVLSFLPRQRFCLPVSPVSFILSK